MAIIWITSRVSLQFKKVGKTQQSNGEFGIGIQMSIFTVLASGFEVEMKMFSDDFFKISVNNGIVHTQKCLLWSKNAKNWYLFFIFGP